MDVCARTVEKYILLSNSLLFRRLCKTPQAYYIYSPLFSRNIKNKKKKSEIPAQLNIHYSYGCLTQ